MKVPFSWLRQYCDPGLDAEQVADLLSMRAIEVERVTAFGAPAGDGLVVGKVIAAEQHPNADRLRVCTVEIGDGKRTIVCGAPNVAAGQSVAVALPGAEIPGGIKLRKAKLRGVESNGMILSEREMTIGDDHDGIAVLDAAPPAGTPLTEVFAISDQVLELDLNPNRSDCFGVYGVARELHAITGAPLAPPPWADDVVAGGTGDVSDLASVKVEVPELCARFTARAFSGVAVGPSPIWLKARLAAAGQRPISNVVDITNYVMLLVGQPLHAFDLDRVPGGELIVRRAADGETMTTLDGAERIFDSESVLVCDRDQPTGIAGIMGGQVSEVSGETSRVLLEAATWDGVNILRTSGRLGLRSEASTRFEKQLHPELALRAQRVASRLLVETAGATLVPGTIDVAEPLPPARVLTLRAARMASLLGVEVDPAEAREFLGRLGFGVDDAGGGDLEVTITPERHFDVAREVDLIEEVGRLHGLDRLPRTLPAHGGRRGGLSREQRLRRLVEDAMRDLGHDEIVSYGFVAPEVADRLRFGQSDPRRTMLRIANPLSEDQSAMRTTLVGGLLDAARHNLAHGNESVALFEAARVYLAEPAPAEGSVAAGVFRGKRPAPDREPHRLGCLVVGPLRPPSWGAPSSPAGFYEMKGTLETLCGIAGCEVALSAPEPPEPFLHPGRSAAITIAGAPAGWIGELHPTIAADWDLPAGVAMELDLAPVFAASRVSEQSFEDVATHPAVLQDLAVVVADDVSAERVRDAVLDGGGALLRTARVFDVYRGEQLGEGMHSLALRLEFRAPDRTLTDAEVAERRELIAAALESIGGALRG